MSHARSDTLGCRPARRINPGEEEEEEKAERGTQRRRAPRGGWSEGPSCGGTPEGAVLEDAQGSMAQARGEPGLGSLAAVSFRAPSLSLD